MDMHAQSDVLFPQTAKTLDFSATVVANRPARKDAAAREPAALLSAVRLLTEANRALSGNQDDARKYIVRAAALLQAESVFGEQDAGGAPCATRGRLAPWQVARVKRFIDDNLGEKIGPQDFAGLVRLSTNHFAKAFRATTGQAPYAFLIRRRIEKVKEMMLETDLPLAHIALDCGLADQAHMTRLFTRLVGSSPGAWRRAHVGEAEGSYASKPVVPVERENGHRKGLSAIAPGSRRAVYHVAAGSVETPNPDPAQMP